MEKSKIQEDIPTKAQQLSERMAYARSCKRLLCNKQILAYLFKEFIEEYKQLSPEEIVKYLGNGTKETIADISNHVVCVRGTMISFDMLFEAMLPSRNQSQLFNIEFQMDIIERLPTMKICRKTSKVFDA